MVENYIRIKRSGCIVYTGQENITADTMSQFPNNGNQNTTHESTY